jgi:hypothetical protein
MAEGAVHETAPYHQAADPLDRLIGYVDFRAAILVGELAEYTCLLGTLAQETYDTPPALCGWRWSASWRAHRRVAARQSPPRRRANAPPRSVTPESLGLLHPVRCCRARLRVRQGQAGAGRRARKQSRDLRKLPHAVVPRRPTTPQARASAQGRRHDHREQRQSTASTPTCFFGGRCQEALDFYVGAIGATIEVVLRFDQSPDACPRACSRPASRRR